MKQILCKAALGLLVVVGMQACTSLGDSPQASTAQAQRTPSVQRAAIAQNLYELAYSPKRNVLFVASAGTPGDNPVPSKVLVLNPSDLRVIEEIALPLRGFGLALDDEADRLYVGHTSLGTISIIDTATRKVLETLPLNERIKGANGRERPEHFFRQLLVDARNHRLYLPGFNNDESTLYIFNTQTRRVDKRIPGMGFTATGVALDAAGHRLFVSNMQGQVTVLDTRTDTVIQRLDIGAEQPLNLAYDAAHNRLLAVDQGHAKMRDFQKRGVPGFESRHPGNRVVAIDLASGKTVAELPAQGPISLRLDPERKQLIVTNRASGQVTVFDSERYTLKHTVDLPAHPNSLAVDPKTGTVYLTIKNAEDGSKNADESVGRVSF